jgi:steroid 5-alpha reductase family enzyme
MMGIPTSLWISAVAIYIYMTGAFVLAMVRKDNSLADIVYGVGFILVAVLTLALRSDFAGRQILATVLVILWGLRLAIHITIRNRGRGEDPRYKKWRDEWGRYFAVRSFLQVFMLQGTVILLIVLPVIIINTTGNTETIWSMVLGTLIWMVGFFFEAVGDYQLYRFTSDPDNRGKVMSFGLWRYTRHPNYFGEITMWWGIFIIASTVPWGWVGVIGPLTITYLLLKVSGIPMLEKMFEGNPEFEAYKKRTSAFFPWFPHSA